MKDFKELFEGVKHPSVHIFRERIAGVSAEEQGAYYVAFALLLSFDYDLKINSFLQYAKTEVFDSADLAEVLLKLSVER
jgi:hypothetical protein